MAEKSRYNALGRYLRSRAADVGLSLAEVARRSGKSRQTLHAIGVTGGRLPELQTLMDLALILRVHPLRMVQLMFEDYRGLEPPTKRAQQGDKSAFLADVTIPDGQVVGPGARFAKTWEVQNVGTVPWERRYLRCVDEEIVVMTLSGEVLRVTERLRPDPLQIDVPFTAPGDVARMSVNFTAPKLPGTCISYWRSFHEDGSLCFPNGTGLTCKIRVLSMGSANAASR